jgi:hypothetical protein
VDSRTADDDLSLTPGEATGVAAVLWELGTAIKDTTGDPDCIAAALYHEAASIESALGLPSWPTDVPTRSAIADFYDAAAQELSARTPLGRPLASGLDSPTVDAYRLVDLLRRGVAALGADGLSSSAVHAGAGALAWALILSRADVGSKLTGGGEGVSDGMDDALREASRLLRAATAT